MTAATLSKRMGLAQQDAVPVPILLDALKRMILASIRCSWLSIHKRLPGVLNQSRQHDDGHGLATLEKLS
jgi:hypothetical protein